MFILRTTIALFVICFNIKENYGKTAKERLWESLFDDSDMNKDLYPTRESGQPVVVTHSLDIQRVVSLENDVLTLNLWEGLKWNDPRLAWDPEKFDNISDLRVPSRLIWQPDLILYNSAEQYTGFISGDLNAVLYSDGKVYLYPPLITKSYCYINESQNSGEISCGLKFGSWTHSGNTMDIELETSQPKLPDFENRKWNTVSVVAVRHLMKYACCPEIYISIDYTLKLKRIKECSHS